MAEASMEWYIRDAREPIGPGCTVMDGWVLKKHLGAGGFGDVWMAEKKLLGVTDQAAIKIIRIPRNPAEIDAMRAEGFSADSIKAELRRSVEKAIREVRAMIDFRDHPGIVRCENFDVIQYEADGTWEIDIRMQLLTSLSDWASGREVKQEDVIRMGSSLSDLLIACENKNILHRDIKPANIFADQLDNFKLGDFGLARVIANSDSTHSKDVGTEAFMAPEVFSTGKYDNRADIYSLGLVMYWLLNHQSLPFTSGTGSRSEAITRRLSGEKLPELRGVDPALDQVIRKACDPNPNKRWKTASEFHEALQMLKPTPPKKKRVLIIAAVALAILVSGYAFVRLLNGLPFFPVPVDSTTIPNQTAIISKSTEHPDKLQNEDTSKSETTAEPERADSLPVNIMLNRYGVTGASVNFRTEPTTKSMRVTQAPIPAGTYVYLIRNVITENNEVWSHVNINGEEGYMKSEFIYMISENESNAYNNAQPSPAPIYTPTSTLTPAPTLTPTPAPTPSLTSEPATADTLPVGEMLNQYGITKYSTYVYSDKNSTSSIKKHLSAGEYIYLIMNEPGGRWSRVSVDGQEGYVTSAYIYALSTADSNAYNDAQSSPAPVYTKEPRSFELNKNVSTDRGRVTVSWVDSEDKSPYSVLFQCIGSSDVIQPLYWANGDEVGSTTNSKSFTIDSLVPGKKYKIEVRDCLGTSISRIYTLPSPVSFTDNGLLKVSSIKIGIKPRWKYASSDYSTASELNSLNAEEIISNMGTKEYGFRYEINYPKLAYSQTFFTQIAITAPNGYVECEVYYDLPYKSEYTSNNWYMLGDWTFKKIYNENKTIPTGTWKVDLYWDGMHVNQSTFDVY